MYNIRYNIKNVNEKVNLNGWVAKKRNLGGLVFIDLRDRSGIIQLVVRPENEFYNLACSLKNESTINVKGTITKRENINNNLETGEIEVDVEELTLYSMSKDIPFEITDDTTALEDTRLKYRYLDLRNEYMQRNLKLIKYYLSIWR